MTPPDSAHPRMKDHPDTVPPATEDSRFSPAASPEGDTAHPPDPVDHRTRTAARRRQAMRRRLLESAMLVFAEKGVDATVIDDVISTAGVSRGTFYKYFSSNRDLMVAASEELVNELLTFVLEQLEGICDPAERVALGLRLYIETALAFPLFARFASTAGMEVAGPSSVLREYLPVHVNDGIAQGRFADLPPQVALDLISGGVLFCIARSTETQLDSQRTRHVVAALLRALGVSLEEAWELADRDVAPMALPEDSLLCRSHQRLRGTKPTPCRP
ncbi:TetR/AcrR family transcriptional regulator [Pseudodonghicola flavimaris]|uniref:TetR/AcrR family transcriptional regulator n=1 Tax=Pseudodonghicola flavimaris TaxID=3050036 RepID=A0ABT7F6C2_9RHOB|nr:TetR/AcrR family transcriptional regulator [Pseudodonghicola flavimaris]MDK3020160.1 TetR/AcrR family transcriptional regulator [Pseudodonghicola flavimaris]